MTRSKAPFSSRQARCEKVSDIGVRRTDKGANRGRMPEAPADQRMIPIVIRRRRAMQIGRAHV